MNRRNLQCELETIIKASEASGIRPKLLLHVCCAPCSSYCLEYLREHFDIQVLFANSNIDDPSEYQRRLEEAQRLASIMAKGTGRAGLEHSAFNQDALKATSYRI